MPIFDITIKINSNYETEEEVMEKFEEWMKSTNHIKNPNGIWNGNSCIIMIGVDKKEE